MRDIRIPTNTQTSTESFANRENVDICLTIVGGEPPKLPLREERLSNGVECIYHTRPVVNHNEAIRYEQYIRELKHEDIEKIKYESTCGKFGETFEFLPVEQRKGAFLELVQNDTGDIDMKALLWEDLHRKDTKINTTCTLFDEEAVIDRWKEHTSSIYIQKGRYHLFVAEACPWSHQTRIARVLKRLEDTVFLSIIPCTWLPRTHDIENVELMDGVTGRWVINCTSVDEMQSSTTKYSSLNLCKVLLGSKHHVTVPILWDNYHKIVVSNNSSDIMRIFNSQFHKLDETVNLYPQFQHSPINDLNALIQRDVNLGVYNCGLATTQQAYKKAINAIIAALDNAETKLAKSTFLVGPKVTEADVKLFVTLIRFDDIYRLLFKVNCRRVSTMPTLLNFVREIYNIPGISKTFDMNVIRTQYYKYVCLDQNPIILPRDSGFIHSLQNNS